VAQGFTDISIKNLKAGAARREIPDPGCAGLYLVLQPSGARSWAVRYRHAGKPKKLTLTGGLSLAAARKLAGDALLAVEQGNDPSAAKKATRAKAAAVRADTVQALIESYLKRESGKLRTGRERRQILERLVVPEIGDAPLSELKRSRLVTLFDKIEDENGVVMSDLVLAFLRKIFNWHAGRVDDFNSPIVAAMRRYDAKANQGSRVLDDDELRRVWLATEPDEKAPSPFCALARFVLLTGCRRDEARELVWSEINDKGDWRLPAARHKNKTEVVRPLSRAAQDVLRGVPVIDGGKFVFSNDGHRPISLIAPFARLMEQTGIEGVRLHDFRRSVRTWLARAGVNSDVAEMCLGHVVGSSVRQIYDRHQYHAEMADAYERLAQLIERIVNPSETVVPLRRQA